MTSTARRFVAVLALAALTVFASVATAHAAGPDPAVQRLERIVRDRVDSGRSTGIVAGMVLADGRTRVVAYGRAGRGGRLNTESVFEIGSITKTFTATALSQMALAGELRLSDPVAALLGAGTSVPSRGGRRITLEDLATQSSGLPRLPDNLSPANPANPYADYTVDQLYDFLRGYRLPRAPGAEFEYSNLGVGLLGHVIALRARQGYEDLVRERVLAPLGMASTSITVPPALAGRFVDGHDYDGRVTDHWDLPTLAGAGALRSSMTDMLAYAKANLESAGPLGPAMAAARAPRRKVDASTRIGLTWFTQRYRGREIVWHDGGTGGFTSFIGLDEARKTAVVVLSNSSREAVADIGFHVLDPRIPLARAPRKHKEIALPVKVLQRYVGVYDLAGARVTVTRSGRRLRARIPGQDDLILYAESARKFFVKVADAQVTFKLDKRGRVTGAVLRQDGQSIALRRIA